MTSRVPSFNRVLNRPIFFNTCFSSDVTSTRAAFITSRRMWAIVWAAIWQWGIEAWLLVIDVEYLEGKRILAFCVGEFLALTQLYCRLTSQGKMNKAHHLHHDAMDMVLQSLPRTRRLPAESTTYYCNDIMIHTTHDGMQWWWWWLPWSPKQHLEDRWLMWNRMLALTINDRHCNKQTSQMVNYLAV